MTETNLASVSKATRLRWYAPTPAKFLFAVLVMQGFLFLSAHYRWFWFNERKGYTVLITVAATAAGLVLLVAAVLVSRFFRSKTQFSLATLLLVIPVTAIPCGWLAREMEQARKQRDVVKWAGSIDIYPSEISKNWFTETLGPDFFLDVTRLVFDDSLTDDGVERLKGLTQLQQLDLDGTRVTDAGLEQLKGLTHLKALFLSRSHVTAAGLQHLEGLGRLEVLVLDGTQVTDTGLEHLKGLTQLREIYLRGTQVTDAGVERLQRALPNCQIRR